MTREKKELLKQLRELDEIEYMNTRTDEQMGEMTRACYEAIEDYYGELRRPIYERLNELMHGRLNDYFQACVI